MSGDPEQEYFADGIVDDIITALSRVRFLFVIARNSSFIYKGKTVDVRQVGRELGVRYVLEGSVRKAGKRIRITGQLIDCEAGRHLWADKLDGDLEDIFALQDRVTRMVLGAIEPSLRLAEMDRVRAKPTADLGAYELYLRALYALNTYDEQSLHEADNLLRAALNRDPNYADAWAVLATTAFFRKVGGFLRHEEARTLGIEAAHRAVQADPENPLALASAAATLCIFGSDYEQALEFADRALSLAPSSSQVLTFCAVAYNFTGQPEKALPLLYEARRLSPRDPRGFTLLHQIAMSHFFSRRFDQAIEWAQRNVTQHPNFTPSRRLMISALAHSGRLEEARDAVRALLEVQPNANVSLVRTIAWQHPWMVALVVDGLRRAGLSE
jgi:adenylate cyclase